MASFKQALMDDFGRVKIFNLLELLPILGCITWGVISVSRGTFDLIDVGILLLGMAASGYLMFLRLISFVVGVTLMVSAFMPILRKLKENER